MEAVVKAGDGSLRDLDVGKLGIWLFILSEVMLFGGFLTSYVMFRWGSDVCRLGAPAWPQAGYTGGLMMASLNTLLLITSSFTMVRALMFVRHGETQRGLNHLQLTMVLGCLFLVVKMVEYTTKFHHGYFPGSEFIRANPGLGVFVSAYFTLTGLHALHVIIGVIWMGSLCFSARHAKAESSLARKVEYAGLYWHFVDLVWVFLFPLFYLI